MTSLFQVTRTLWADNDIYYDSEIGTPGQQEIVGIFATRAEAEIVKEEVDKWPRSMSGESIDVQEDNDGNEYRQTISYWGFSSACTITELVLGKVCATPYSEVEVAHATAAQLKREEEENAYRRKQEREQELCDFFNDHGASRHLEFLALDLAKAGCETLEDVLSIGADEFIKRIGYDGSRLNSDSQKKEGLRDFQRAIERKDFRMSANHARHRQPGGWAAGPVAGYESSTPARIALDDDTDLPF